MPCSRRSGFAQKPDRNHCRSRSVAHASATMRPSSSATRKMPVFATWRYPPATISGVRRGAGEL